MQNRETARGAVLVVSSMKEDRRALEAIFVHSSWKLRWARNKSEALAAMEQCNPWIVICERDLPDGDWKDILGEAGLQPDSPLVIVISRLADAALWAEVLNLGGYDLLLKPLDRLEVTRVVALASQRWIRRSGVLLRKTPGFGLVVGTRTD